MHRHCFASRLRCKGRRSAGGDTDGDSRQSPSCPPLPPGLSLTVALPSHQAVVVADSGLIASALARAARDDYPAWLAQATATGGCSRPVRLRGQVHHIDSATGEILRIVSTADAPDGGIYTACGDRRASVCPACAETYRPDAYQLIRAGIAGGKGKCPISGGASVRVRHLHRALVRSGARPAHQPGRAGPALPTPPQPQYCPHGPDLRCPPPPQRREPASASRCARTATTTRRRRLERTRARTVAAHHDRPAAPPGPDRPAPRHPGQGSPTPRWPSSRRRGLVHFHALIRLDGHDPHDPAAITGPPPA